MRAVVTLKEYPLDRAFKRKPKLQEQETEKHTCTSSQTHSTSTHGYCSSISCTQEWYLLTLISDNVTQHYKSHTNISDNGTQPLKGKWIGLQVCVFSGGDEVCSCGSLVQKQEAEKHPPLKYWNKKLKSILVTSPRCICNADMMYRTPAQTQRSYCQGCDPCYQNPDHAEARRRNSHRMSG